MITKPKYFSIDELVCPHIYDHYGQRSWQFFDTKLLVTLETIRDRIGKPIYINDWQVHGKYSQRGLRCFKCDIVKTKIEADEIYMSAHCLGKGADFDVQGLTAEEVRLWIITHKNWWPYYIRLERDVNWVHLDVFDLGVEEKVYLFSNGKN
jgi:hypothetical protein